MTTRTQRVGRMGHAGKPKNWRVHGRSKRSSALLPQSTPIDLHLTVQEPPAAVMQKLSLTDRVKTFFRRFIPKAFGGR